MTEKGFLFSPNRKGKIDNEEIQGATRIVGFVA